MDRAWSSENRLAFSMSAGIVSTDSYSGSPEGLFSGAFAPKYAFGPTGLLAQQDQLFRTQAESSVLALPELSVIGGAPGHGFTCTGIDIDAAGNYVVGCDGGVIESTPPSSGAGYTCGLVRMSPAGANLGEINIRSMFGLAQTATVQGVAVDRTDGSLWAACGPDGVKHVSGSWPSPAVLSGGFSPASGNANGLCIDSKRDHLITLAAVPVGQVQLDVYNRSDRSFVQTVTMGPNGVGGSAATFNSVDHITYDAARDYLWITAGDNGASGQVFAYKASDFTFVGSAILPQATTIEGLLILNGQFVIANDGYYHSATSGGNGFDQLQFYPAVKGFANVAWPIEYDATTHALLGYLIEPAFARLNDNPRTQGDATWTKTSCTVATLTQVSPTGATDANTVTATAGASVHELFRNAGSSISAGGVSIQHDMLKMGTQRYIWTGDRGDAVIHSATFDLQAGTVVGSSNCTASIKGMGNGWYRCTRVQTNTNARAALGGNIAFPSGSAHAIDRPSWTALGTETFHVYAHEIGAAEYPTSPVFGGTAGSTETRAADVASVATSTLGLSATVNTFFAQGRTARGVGATTPQVMFQIDDGSESNRIRLVRDTSKHLRFIVTVGGAQQCNLDLGVVADETDFKAAMRCKAADFSASINGGAVVTSASGALPTVTTFRPGMSFTGEQWAGWIKVFQIKASGDADAVLVTEST